MLVEDRGLLIAVSGHSPLNMPEKLLIIEDDPDILNILNYIFKTEGFEVVLSENGKEAEHLAEILPDLILMDVRLKHPGPHGDAICLRLKTGLNTRCFPVILLSAENGLREISHSCGADGFICKPFDIPEFIGKVREILDRPHLNLIT
jgi:two-component system, OmpR family, response regulator VicR